MKSAVTEFEPGSYVLPNVSYHCMHASIHLSVNLHRNILLKIGHATLLLGNLIGCFIFEPIRSLKTVDYAQNYLYLIRPSCVL